MAGSKKRKESVQSSTLHDFFASSPLKKAKSGTMAPETMKRAAKWDVDAEDIIVISDDEDEARAQPEFVCGSSNGRAIELEERGSTCRTPANALLHGKAEVKRQPAEDWSISEPSGEEILPTNAGTIPFIKSFSNEPEEWGMGDDEEMPSQEDDEEDIETESKAELCQGQYPDVNNVCPICGKKLKGLFKTEVDRHVNCCIDALSGSPPIKLEVKEHKPLSVVQPPLSAANSMFSKPGSAFSVLMSSHKENDAWKEASEAENKKGNLRGRRPAPFYKVMQGMPIAVDAFRYGRIPEVTAYFLTHAHSDHYTNLSSSWKHGPIYCSQTTANLIIHVLDVDPKWVFPLPMDKPTVVPNTGGVEVTLIQANHCPGSVLFLFNGLQTVNAGDSTFKSSFIGSTRTFRYLHCGDFRACPQHVNHPEIRGKKIDTVYLDTTYLDPKYCFPPQPLVISACAELARRIVCGNQGSGQATGSGENLDKHNNGKGLMASWVTGSEKGKERAKTESKTERVLVVVGTYTIGKERIVKAIANALSTKVYCDARKTAVLRCLSDPELHAMLTSDPFAAGVHVVPLHVINSDKFKDYLSKWKGHWTKAVGFRPTGWTYTSPTGTDTLPSIPYIISRDQSRTFTHAHLRPMRNSTPTLMLYGVPYSEHSSFFELTCFALSLDWGKMIATVNVGSAKSREKMGKWFERWQGERNKRKASGGGSSVVQFRQPDYW